MNKALRFCYKNKTIVPPLGWWVELENTIIRGGDWDDLLVQCHKFITSLGKIPPPDLPDKIENALCNRMAGNPNCTPCSSVKQSLGFGAIVRWVKAMYEFSIKNKFELVNEEEANRRAEICAKCPLQISTSGCWGCKGIAGFLPAIAGAKTTPFDSQLKACGICGCYNAVSVHLPLDIQQDSNLNFPDYCWKKAQNG